MEWTKDKPDFECVLVGRWKYANSWLYEIVRIEKVEFPDCSYLGWLDKNGHEQGALKDMTYEEYLILETIPERS